MKIYRPWTTEEYARLEKVLEDFPADTADRWHKIAASIGIPSDECKQRAGRLKNDVQGTPQTQPKPIAEKRVLLLGGVGIFEYGDDPMVDSLHMALGQYTGRVVDCLKFSPKNAVDWLKSSKYDTCVVFQLQPSAKPFYTNAYNWQQVLHDWVQEGGKLIFYSGEGEKLAKLFRYTFGLKWSFGSYRRTTYEFQASSSLGDVIKTHPLVPKEYNVKAYMLSNVSTCERVFQPESGTVSYSLVPFMAGERIDEEMAALACTKGFVAFFADVNMQTDSCLMAAAVASVDPTKIVSSKIKHRRDDLPYAQRNVATSAR